MLFSILKEGAQILGKTFTDDLRCDFAINNSHPGLSHIYLESSQQLDGTRVGNFDAVIPTGMATLINTFPSSSTFPSATKNSGFVIYRLTGDACIGLVWKFKTAGIFDVYLEKYPEEIKTKCQAFISSGSPSSAHKRIKNGTGYTLVSTHSPDVTLNIVPGLEPFQIEVCKTVTSS